MNRTRKTVLWKTVLWKTVLWKTVAPSTLIRSLVQAPPVCLGDASCLRFLQIPADARQSIPARRV